MKATENEITNNEKLSEILPMLREQFDFINSSSVRAYEDKLAKTTDKALNELERIIDDQTLALDPEQLINAVKVLTTSRKDLAESKRRLIDTLLRGEVMIKSIEGPKKTNEDNVLIEYLKSKGVDTNTNAGVTSIFQQVNNLEEDDEES